MVYDIFGLFGRVLVKICLIKQLSVLDNISTIRLDTVSTNGKSSNDSPFGYELSGKDSIAMERAWAVYLDAEGHNYQILRDY